MGNPEIFPEWNYMQILQKYFGWDYKRSGPCVEICKKEKMEGKKWRKKKGKKNDLNDSVVCLWDRWDKETLK